MRELVIDGRRIHDDGDCYVIAEIGHNHQGDVERAKELFRAAKECGVDAVKLQKRDNRSLFTRDVLRRAVRQREQLRPDLRRAQGGARARRGRMARAAGLRARARRDALRDRVRPAERRLPGRARRAGVQDRFRRHRRTLNSCAMSPQLGKPMLVPTGGATLDDVDRAVDDDPAAQLSALHPPVHRRLPGGRRGAEPRA